MSFEARERGEGSVESIPLVDLTDYYKKDEVMEIINNLIREESNLIKDTFNEKFDDNFNLISKHEDKI